MLRKNRFHHSYFKPSLETTGVKKLLRGIYEPNQPDTADEILMNMTEYAISSGNYKDQSVRLYEIFNREDYQKPKDRAASQLALKMMNAT